MILKDGKFYARVSEILNPFCDFSHIDPVVLKKKCDIGTMVHDAIADEVNHNFPVVTGKAIGYFNSYLKWKEKVGVEFIQSEKRYFDDEKMITGCIDAIVKIGGNKTGRLLDFKTSAQESVTWIMQGHLYYHLLKSNLVHVPDFFFFVKLDPYGGLPKVFEYRIEVNIMAKCMIAIDDFWKNVESRSN